MTIINNRYALSSLLGSGGMGAVYQAHDRLTGDIVALKQLHVSYDLTDDRSRLALANEFRTLSSLRHPHIISVLNYGFDRDRNPFYTMTLLQDGLNLIAAAHACPLAVRVGYAIQALQALAYLHRRGIIHRDIKPSNLLVTGGQRLYVLDFGLADTVGLTTRQNETAFRGTLAYSAPETLEGRPHNPAVDVYAMGVVMYELFSGQHPFDTSSIQRLLNDILTATPDWNRIDGPPQLVTIIQRMMARDPASRYDNADQIIDELALLLEGNNPHAESPALRESYLQAADFVGRQHEINLLSAAVSGVLNGHHSAWLIGGESGVGKTRLIEHARTLALVKGAQVGRGQAVAEGGLPFTVWRDIVAQLLLSTDVSDLEAAILRRIVPQIEQLLDRPIPEAPSLGDSADHQRLVNTITALIRRQQRPTVLILEDLHWASESLLPLQQLLSDIDDVPLLIIASYRNDEAPDLPAQLPTMRVLQLRRLNHHEIEQLTASIVGHSGNLPALVDFIDRQTEGNVFFIVETVRELAKEAGRLSAIDPHHLPDRIQATGIQAVIARRLARLAPDEQMLLKMTATAGRDIDLKILRALLDHYRVDSVTDFLTNAVNTAILDVMDGNYRFAHDKIREAMIDSITKREWAYVHLWVAKAIEAAYPHDPYQAIYLADHYREAGDHEREVHFTIMAGQQRQAVSAFREAIDLYTRVLDRMDYDDPRRPDTLIRLGDSHLQMGYYDEADAILQQALAFAETRGDQFARANAHYCLSQVAAMIGDFAAAETLLLSGFDASISNNSPILGRLYYGLADVKWRQNDLNAADHYARLSLDMAEVTNDIGQMMYALNRLGTVAFFRGDLDTAEAIHLENRDRALSVGNLERANAAIGNLGAIATERGDYAKARQYANESLQLAQQIGHFQAALLQASNIATLDVLEGDFDGAAREYRRILEQAIAKDLPTFVLIAISGFASIALEDGRPDQAVTWLTMIRQHPAADVNVINESDTMLEKAHKLMYADAYHAAIAEGTALHLDAVVAAFLG